MGERSAEVITRWLSPENLVDFIDELREAGYNIGLSEYIDAQRLILTLIEEGDRLDDTTRLRSYLGPLLCSSPYEQEDFQSRFDHWIDRARLAHSEPAHLPLRANTLQQALTVAERQSRRSWWVLAAGSTLFMVGLLSYSLGIIPSIPPAMPPASSATPTPPPSPTPETPTTPPLPVAPTPRPTPHLLEQPQKGSGFLGIPPIWVLAFVVLLLIPPFIYLFNSFWGMYRARMFLVRLEVTEEPELGNVSLPNFNKGLFPSPLALRTATYLRRRVEVPSNRLDVEATVNRTCHQGWLSPVYKSRQFQPEYLVLVDRADYGDHQAHFATEIVDLLRRLEIFVTEFYFNQDPRICFPKEGGHPVKLEDISTRYAHHRLIIFSSAEGFFSPISGRMQPWVEAFSSWQQRSVLTPEAPEQWGQKEIELSREFTILPATLEGLSASVRSTEGGQVPFSYENGNRSALPRELRLRPLRWIERGPPEPDEVNDLLESLKVFLGESGFQWMSACAVYPALHWNLTLYLGTALVSGDGRQLIHSNCLPDLVRLPWFRYGYMPDWLRSALLSSLPPIQERGIRLALESLFVASVQGSVDSFQLEIAREHRKGLSNISRPLLRLLSRRAPPDSRLREHVFLRFMSGQKQSRLGVRLPEAVRNSLARGRQRERKPFWSALQGITRIESRVATPARFAIPLVGLTMGLIFALILLQVTRLPAETLVREEFTSQQEVERVREMLADMPPVVLVWPVSRGLESIFYTGESATRLVWERFPITLEIVILGGGLAVLLAWGLALGLRRRHRGITFARMSVASLAAMPVFWLGLMMTLVLALSYDWLPPLVYENFWDDPKTNLLQVSWPIIAVGLIGGLWTSLEMRSREDASSLAVLARALGLVLRHGGMLLSGVILLEIVFVIPGMGVLLQQSAFRLDAAILGASAAVIIWLALLSRLLGNLLLVAVDGNPGRTEAIRVTESGRALIIGGGITLGLLLLLFLAPFVTSQDPLAPDLQDRLIGPSAAHWLGTDQLGRDIFSRVVHGGRTAALIGLPMGLLSLLGGFLMANIRVMLDRARASVLMYGTEGVLEALVAVPWLVIGILIQANLGGGWPFVALAAMLLPRALRVGWELGADGPLQVAHLAPVALRLGALFLAAALAMSAALGFLGLGVPPPQADFGMMVAEGRSLIVIGPWVLIFPGLVLTLVTASWLVVAALFARSGAEYRPVGWVHTMS